MRKYENELERQIVEKNRALDFLSRNSRSSNEEVERVKRELDKLLYTYYKSIGCDCSAKLVLWTAAG